MNNLSHLFHCGIFDGISVLYVSEHYFKLLKPSLTHSEEWRRYYCCLGWGSILASASAAAGKGVSTIIIRVTATTKCGPQMIFMKW